MRSSSGWDGKLRVPKTAQLANPEALSDPEYSDDDNVVPGEEVAADEGMALCSFIHLYIWYLKLMVSGKYRHP
jgi:hypothetical protein